MSSWLQRFKGDDNLAQKNRSIRPAAHKRPRSRSRSRQRSIDTTPVDPNVPKKRYAVHQKCLYERTLPGQAYISAHVNRLQHGYWESSALHEPVMNNLYFVSVHFVFHPQDPRSHRFKSAEIQVSVHGDNDTSASLDDPRYQPVSSHPRILKHAPDLMFGAVSPENLQWNFSLSSSLGVSQAPVSANLNPAGGVKGSYKLFHMMSIQGSVRSKPSPLGPRYNVEDALAVWTLEENLLQRSGLPREFDFVLLIHKPDDVKNVYMTVDVDAEIDAWCGAYPRWYTEMKRFLPTQDFKLDLDTEIGQRFVPNRSSRGKGFNFATLPHPLDEYVTMPGTVYPTNDTKAESDDDRHRGQIGSNPLIGQAPFEDMDIGDNKTIEASPDSHLHQRSTRSRSRKSPSHDRIHYPASHRHSSASENVNVRVVLEHQYPPHMDPRRFSYSPLSNYEPIRAQSIRRRKSRSGLKEYSAEQALREVARNVLQDGDAERSRGEGLNGHT